MRRLFFALALLLCGFGAAPAEARVKIDIDLETQTMRVEHGGADYVWPVSTARQGFVTPRGSYRARRLALMHYSRKYHGSPMPHSIFFAGGYAIHGSYETAALGRPASHGCVRLSPGHAAMLFAMVKRSGADIRISGSPPAASALADRRRGRDLYAAAAPRAARSSLSYREPWMREDAWDGWR